MGRIYYDKLKLGFDSKSGDKLLWLVFNEFEDFKNKKTKQKHEWLVRWDIVDQLYVFRHFVQQVNMLSQLKDKIDSNGNIKQLAQELSKGLENAIKEVNKAKELSDELNEFKAGEPFVQTSRLRKKIPQIYWSAFLIDMLEEGGLYEEFVKQAGLIKYFDKLRKSEGLTKKQAALKYLAYSEISDFIEKAKESGFSQDKIGFLESVLEKVEQMNQQELERLESELEMEKGKGEFFLILVAKAIKWLT